MPALDSLYDSGSVPITLGPDFTSFAQRGLEEGQPDSESASQGRVRMGDCLEGIPSPEVLDQEAQTP